MVSASKAPEVIARDIGRRLLADATEMHSLLTERAEARRAGARAQHQLYTEMVDHWSAQFHELSDRQAQTYAIRLGCWGEPVTASARVPHGAKWVDFEIRVSGPDVAALAATLAEFLRGLREQQTAPQPEPAPQS
ncbi:hypothetical protein BJF78_30085 [Pseudonocardia sp. CNS-139]|nr:hypothetical protein BJF78_30085 [Pseudonocardia sp. CNS-139]